MPICIYIYIYMVTSFSKHTSKLLQKSHKIKHPKLQRKEKKKKNMSETNIESYPPIFRQLYNPIQKPDTKNQQIKLNTPINNIDMLPIVDMQHLDLDNLDKICREWGIFRLVNHGIPTNLLKSLHEYAKKILDIPYEVKDGLIGNYPINYFWGTPALTKEGKPLRRRVSGHNFDWMEGFNVPFSQLCDSSPLIDDHTLFNPFRKLLEEYSEFITKTAVTIYEAMIESLKLDVQVARRNIDESSGLIRVYRYPKHSNNVGDIKGLHVHTDSSIVSILSEAEVGGLKFLKDDQWYDVQPVPGTLIVNLGDMMQVMSDDKYKSVQHKVELNKQKARLSVCYFVFPEKNTLLHSSIYKPFTYNDFRDRVQLDLKTIGHKIALQSFKL
ncbi:gibberellin 2-beta-dioxygenase 8-like [Silene latifolia]|uniref:gibberellin 2-beta-dioxygenase 8-like n=1 Tax=Silene latifolia TaxID=37657 RepID=UPI003D781E72